MCIRDSPFGISWGPLHACRGFPGPPAGGLGGLLGRRVADISSSYFSWALIRALLGHSGALWGVSWAVFWPSSAIWGPSGGFVGLSRSDLGGRVMPFGRC
eukprot:7006602-Pyramimonas_sp.AAC.1